MYFKKTTSYITKEFGENTFTELEKAGAANKPVTIAPKFDATSVNVLYSIVKMVSAGTLSIQAAFTTLAVAVVMSSVISASAATDINIFESDNTNNSAILSSMADSQSILNGIVKEIYADIISPSPQPAQQPSEKINDVINSNTPEATLTPSERPVRASEKLTVLPAPTLFPQCDELPTLTPRPSLTPISTLLPQKTYTARNRTP